MILLFALLSGLAFKIIEKINDTGNTYAKIVYQNEVILMINLKNNEYHVYDTIYKEQVHVARAQEGIYYVPGKTTTEMTELYLTDEYAETNQIVGIKVVVADQKISVAYQESPKDLCQFQKPTSSPLVPIVCLPNELVINVYTDIESDQFIPDSVLE
ncbi:MAG: NusG domain II-containing protein [Candidatus Izemoplasmatales bacterium]|nr:NusG domain II-containing protein [Candidatus Izemoplasmatales bacterium]